MLNLRVLNRLWEIFEGYKVVVLSFSGGKDSTYLLHHALEVKRAFPDRDLFVLYADGKVDNPLIKAYAEEKLKEVGGFKVEPPPCQRWWALVIGRGYALPRPGGFRWCEARLKIRPLARFQRALRKRYKSVASIIGMRASESPQREKRMKRLMEGFELKDKEAPVPTFVPIFDVPTEEVFSFIAEKEPFLYSLYRRAGGQNARFGCFVCPLVKEDKSLKSLLEHHPFLKPYADLREFLLSVDKPENRGRFSKKGKDLGTGRGFLKFAVRKEILNRVKAFEQETGIKLLSPAEERCIYSFWEEEKRKGILE